MKFSRASAIQMLSNAGLFASMAFIPSLASELGATRTQVGIIVASYALAFFLANYIFGRLADIHGRKKYLILGLALSAAAAVFQIYASTPTTLALVRFLLGFTAGIFPPALLAYAHDTKKKMGKFASYGSIGWGIGVLVAGLLGAYYQIFLFTALLLFLSFLFALLLPRSQQPAVKVPLFPLELIKRNAGVYTAIIIRHSSANMIWVTFPIFLETIGANHAWIGILYASNTVTQFFVMQSIERFKEEYLIYVGLIFSALTFLSFTVASNPWQFIPTQIILGASWSCLYVGSLKRVLKKNVEKATATGLLSSSISISAIIGSLMGGVLSQFLGFHGPMYLAALLTLVSLVLARRYIR